MVQELDVSEIVEVCSPAESLELHAGEFLFQEGDDAHALYVVKKGVLRVVSGSTIYETVRTGGIVGEMAIIDERTRSASVIAGTHCELLEIDVPEFLSLITDQSAFRADRHAGDGAPAQDHGPALRAELARGAGLTWGYAASDFSFGLI
jgi:CRP/FNR family cyclic AMP-dependent transcriptional regulator